MFFPIPPPTHSTGGSAFGAEWRTVCRFFGVLIAVPASLWVVLAYFFTRIEEAGDYETCLLSNALVGGMLALSFLLLCAPHLTKAVRWRYVATAVGAVLIWVTVSGVLTRSLEEQVRSKSKAVIEQAPEP